MEGSHGVYMRKREDRFSELKPGSFELVAISAPRCRFLRLSYFPRDEIEVVRARLARLRRQETAVLSEGHQPLGSDAVPERFPPKMCTTA